MSSSRHPCRNALRSPVNRPSTPLESGQKRFGYTSLSISASASYAPSRTSIRAFLFPPDPRLCSFSVVRAHFYPQWKLGRRSRGRLTIWVQTPLRHPDGRVFRRYSPGIFPPLLSHVANHLSSASGQKCLACRLGVVTGLGQLVSFRIIFYPRPLTLVNRPSVSLSTPLLQSG